MNDPKTIQKIQETETEAEVMISKAKNAALAKKAELEEQMQNELAHIADTLTQENAAIAQKIKSEAQEYKNEASATLKQRLAKIENGSDNLIKQSVQLVKEYFQNYVG